MTSAFLTKDFSDYCAQKDAQNTIQLNVRKWTLMLCDALKQNYIEYCIKSHNRSIAVDGDPTNYHHESIEKLKNGESDYDFIIESGRKYHKIVMVTNQRSSHAFVDKKTGEVYKPASWKAPAKGVRFNLNIINEREWLFENADWSGSYLYKK